MCGKDTTFTPGKYTWVCPDGSRNGDVETGISFTICYDGDVTYRWNNGLLSGAYYAKEDLSFL